MRLTVNGVDVGRDRLVATNLCVRYALTEGKINIEVMHIETVGENERMFYDCTVDANPLDVVEIKLGTAGQSEKETSREMISRNVGTDLLPTHLTCTRNGETLYQRQVTNRSIVEMGIVHRDDLPYILSISSLDNRNGKTDWQTTELGDSDVITIIVGGKQQPAV